MATAYFGSAGYTPGSNTTSVSVTLPGSIPTNTLGIFITSNNSQADTISAPTNASVAWTYRADDSPGTTLHTYMYSKQLGPGDSGTNVTATWSGSGKVTAGVILISDAEWDTFSTVQVDNSTDTSASWNNVTPSVADCMLIAVGAGQHPSTTTISSFTGGWTARLAAYGTAALPVTSAIFYTRQLTGGSGVSQTGPTATWSVASRDVTWQVSAKPKTTQVETATGTLNADLQFSSTEVHVELASGEMPAVLGLEGVAEKGVETHTATGEMPAVLGLTSVQVPVISDARTLPAVLGLTSTQEAIASATGSLPAVAGFTGAGVKSSAGYGEMFLNLDIVGTAKQVLSATGEMGVFYDLIVTEKATKITTGSIPVNLELYGNSAAFEIKSATGLLGWVFNFNGVAFQVSFSNWQTIDGEYLRARIWDGSEEQTFTVDFHA